MLRPHRGPVADLGLARGQMAVPEPGELLGETGVRVVHPSEPPRDRRPIRERRQVRGRTDRQRRRRQDRLDRRGDPGRGERVNLARKRAERGPPEEMGHERAIRNHGRSMGAGTMVDNRRPRAIRKRCVSADPPTMASGWWPPSQDFLIDQQRDFAGRSLMTASDGGPAALGRGPQGRSMCEATFR